MSSTENNRCSEPTWKKPSYVHSEGHSVEPSDEDWLISLAQAPFWQRDAGPTFPDSDPVMDAAANFGRFLFDAYRRKHSSGNSLLSDCGSFGKNAAKFLERWERAYALQSAAIDKESREITCWSESQRTDPNLIQFSSKGIIHKIAASKYPHLFQGPFVPGSRKDHRAVSAMWKDAGFDERDQQPHSSEDRWIRVRLLQLMAADGKPVHPDSINPDDLDSSARTAAHRKAAQFYPEFFTGPYRPLSKREGSGGDALKVESMWIDMKERWRTQKRPSREPQ